MPEKYKREVLGVDKITYKYQVTIPKRVRKGFGLKVGELIVFIEEDGRLILAKSTEL